MGWQCFQFAQQDAFLITNNHAVKCNANSFPSGESCDTCPQMCVSCKNVSSCDICSEGTSLSSDGLCVVFEDATTQTHNGAVACTNASLVVDTACEPCSAVFGAGCELCTANECLSCTSDFVLEDGVCRRGKMCEMTDGTVCTSCVNGAIPFNATDCVASDDCAVYIDGTCVTCVEEYVRLPNGTCAAADNCTVHNGGGCLRCADGMFPDAGDTCHCLESLQLTSSV